MNRLERPEHRLIRPLLALGLTIAAGVLGFVLIEGWSFGDALFMVVTSVATVGFGEVRPLSTTGRLLVGALIAAGVVTISYTLTVLVGMVVDGHLTRHREHRRMEKRIDRTTGHQIVCGYGRVGRQIAHELRREGRTVAVVDVDPAALAVAADAGMLTVLGDATHDDTLRRAGIERAVGLITAVADDADNVFVALSARALRPDLLIVARANHDDVVPKLRRAGADQVVSPYAMAGRLMARFAVRPASVDFVETLLDGAGPELLLENVHVAVDSPLVGLDPAQVCHRFAADALLVAVQRDGATLVPPPVDFRVRSGDVIAAVGRETQLRALEQACRGAGR